MMARSARKPLNASFTRSNALIQSDDARVIELARRAVGNINDPWQKAAQIEKWVKQNLTEKNFKTAFAPAAEVARNLAGDCTEHSVLAAAMCRAVGVPARIAVGLVYVQDLGGFGYHMWNEVYVNRRWVAFDATFDQSEVDAVHIKLSDSSLDGVAPFETFLPIAAVLGKLSIEPIENPLRSAILDKIIHAMRHPLVGNGGSPYDSRGRARGGRGAVLGQTVGDPDHASATGVGERHSPRARIHRWFLSLRAGVQRAPCPARARLARKSKPRGRD